MKYAKRSIVFLIFVLIGGCASGLNSIQEREYRAMELEGVLVEEKKVTTAAALGILPGGGSFYVREPALGVVNLLFWPLSILWDPISGYEGAKAINYDITKYKLKKDMQAEIDSLNKKLEKDEITSADYVLEKDKIERKYNYEL